MKRFVAALRADDKVALKASGNSTWFRKRIQAHAARVVAITPSRLEMLGLSVKSADRQDARAIAFFLSRNMLPEAHQRSEIHLQLRSLISTRARFLKMRAPLLNRAHAVFVRHGIRIKYETLIGKRGFENAVESRDWSRLGKLEIDAISSQLESIRENCKRMEKIIAADARTLPGYGHIASIKGIGPLSAAVLLCAIGDIGRFPETGNLAAFFGITPRASSPSGSRRVGRITKRGDKVARTTLVQCTLIAKRNDPYLQTFFERTKARRGSEKAIVATSRKLLNTIFHTLKHGWVFEDFAAFKLKKV